MSGTLSPNIIRHKSVTSTNEVLKELAKKGAVPGTVIMADTQTAGRGRGQHTWHSPVGGLYLSALLTQRPSHGRFTDLSLLAGVALAQTVAGVLPKQTDISLKWPNDCLVSWKKVGGILCEAAGPDDPPLCVVGMGLNVNVTADQLKQFQQTTFSATSFSIQLGGGQFEVEHVGQVLISKLFMLHSLYQQQGFQPVQYLWEKNCRFIVKKIALRGGAYREGGETKAELGETTGIFQGIDESGALVLSDLQGGRRAYFAGEITCFWP